MTTLLVSLAMGFGSKLFLTELGLGLSIVVLFTIVLVGIIFDIVGTAVMSADEKPFHAMAAKRVVGAPHAIRLIRNADKVANFCCDMVGDICGTVSGAVGAAIVFIFVTHRPNLDEPVLSTVLVAIVAAATVSGKAMGKGYAITKSNSIIFMSGQVLSFIERTLKLHILSDRRNKKRNGRTAR